MALSRRHLADRVKELARQAGFDLAGVTSASPLPEVEEHLLEALRDGRLRVFPWMDTRRARLMCHPREYFPPARSVLCVGMSYLGPCHQSRPEPLSPESRPEEDRATTYRDQELPFPPGKEAFPPGKEAFPPGKEAFPSGKDEGGGGPVGIVARYARCLDYHNVIKERLQSLLRSVEAEIGRPVQARICVDTSPLAEKALAQRAGLGWQGKNTLLINPSYGSWLVLGEILWDLDLEPDPPAEGSCGDCDLCLRACPSGALHLHALYASRCISYLTVEHRGEVPAELQPLIGQRLFGCDACQDVCPYNWQPQPGSGRALHPVLPAKLSLAHILEMDEDGFAACCGATPLSRPRLSGLQRNARLVYSTMPAWYRKATNCS